MTTQPTNNEFDSDAVENLLRKRLRTPGKHYKLAASDRSLAIDIHGQPYVDRGAMSARAVISTATVDRVGDLLIPRGCQLENYAKNPVVMWAHGLEGISAPIGTSRDSQGGIAVTVTDDDVQATAWFSQKSLEAAQIFELIDEGIVRATSVRETPRKSKLQRGQDDRDVLVVEVWELEEWSWCAIGVNPDAVAKALDRNRLGGQPIVQSIVKSLMSVAPPVKRWGIGLPLERKMNDTKESNEDGLTDLSNIGSDDGNCDTSPFDATDQPYGATVVSSVHAALSAAVQNIQDAMGPLENPTVKQGLSAILSALHEQLTAVEGLHDVSYPDRPSLKADDAGEGDDSDDDNSDSMKAFLAAGRIAPLQVFGLGSRLKRLVGAKNLTLDQRRSLTDIAKQLGSLVTQSKAYQRESDDVKIATLQRSIGELTTLVENIKK